MGFTLIELLVVIAILSILAAILFPVFATARDKARASACSSNEKQIGLAFLQYAQDYDEVLPCGRAGGGMGWAAQVYPYLRSWAVFTCPNDVSNATSTKIPFSYAINENLNYEWAALKPLPLNKFTAPDKTVALFEVHGIALTNPSILETASPSAYGYTQAPPNGGGRYATGDMGNRQFNAAADPQHGPGSNFVAADGHVKFLTGDKVSTYNAAVSATSQEVMTTNGNAAGCDNMTGPNGAVYTLTFSRI